MRARMKVHHLFFLTLLLNLGALRPSISCRKTDVVPKIHNGWKQKKWPFRQVLRYGRESGGMRQVLEPFLPPPPHRRHAAGF